MPVADEDYRAQVKRDRDSKTVALKPLLDILAGLEELHRMGFVHRDLKPANVLLVDGRWVIADFGLIRSPKTNTKRLTGTASAYGTEMNAAPEQVTDFRHLTSRADIYAFGCILHDIVADSPLRIPYANHSAGGPFGKVIDTCTRTEPDERYADVATLRTELILSASEPLPLSETQEVNRWVERLKASPDSLTASDWAEIIGIVEQPRGPLDDVLLLRAIDVRQIRAATNTAPKQIGRICDLVCRWVREGTFSFEFCDVLAARLDCMYTLGDINIKALVTMSSLRLAMRHNRFLVMRLFLRMAGTSISDNLADRLLIEFKFYGTDIRHEVTYLQQQLISPYPELHPKLSSYVK